MLFRFEGTPQKNTIAKDFALAARQSEERGRRVHRYVTDERRSDNTADKAKDKQEIR